MRITVACTFHQESMFWMYLLRKLPRKDEVIGGRGLPPLVVSLSARSLPGMPEWEGQWVRRIETSLLAANRSRSARLMHRDDVWEEWADMSRKELRTDLLSEAMHMQVAWGLCMDTHWMALSSAANSLS